MRIPDLLRSFDGPGAGGRMKGWMAELYPICRSITGPGLLQTLQWIARRAPLTIHSVPSGTQVFDWRVPDAWEIRDAWIKGPDGRKVVDFRDLNLHVVNYSPPVHETMSLEQLRPHLHTLPDHPDWVPYRTSYYQRRWGFCLAHRVLEQLPPGPYEVFIDSTLAPGELHHGEAVLPGAAEDEVLLSCHVCHPSLCNDNLSGLVVAVSLAELLGRVRRRYTYRFLFLPGTIGSITWLARNPEAVERIRHGLVLACLGDPGRFHYKRSRRGQAEIDRAVLHVLKMRGRPFEALDFSPYGYDERQYNSPGFNLPVGALSRTPHGRFPEYHTSADNLELVTPEALAESLAVHLEICDVLEGNVAYRNLNPRCEPQLGRRGLYEGLGGSEEARQREMALLWVLNLSDGDHSLLDVAERAQLPFRIVREAADALLRVDLLAPATADGAAPKATDDGRPAQRA